MLSENEIKELKAKENLDPSKGAINIVSTLPRKPDVCQHQFTMGRGVQGLEAKCLKCEVGYVLTGGAVVRDGHIYIKEDKLI